MNRKDKWTSDEINILKKSWKKIEPHDIKIWKSLLPNRNYCAIKTEAKRLNINRDLSRFSKKKEFTCVICGNTFTGYGNKIICSRKCTAKYMSKNRIGENNPYFNKNKGVITICLYCGNDFMWSRCGQHVNIDRKFCSKECSSKYYSKEKSSKWKGGIQYYPYSNEFNEELKNIIKERDDFSCRVCGEVNDLCIHHIDYDKQNCKDENLITLCRSCHGKTNSNRLFWENILTFITTNHKIVVKSWGFEFIPVNNDDYCLKALVFWEGCNFSNHYHKIKKESWYILHGEMLANLIYPDCSTKEFIFKKGDVLDIGQGLCHQLKAIKNTILIEVSTHHEDEDSYRVVTGGLSIG